MKMFSMRTKGYDDFFSPRKEKKLLQFNDATNDLGISTVSDIVEFCNTNLV